MAFCEKCGAQLAEDAKFCAQCGASTAPAAEAIAAAEAASAETPVEAPKAKKGLPKWAKIVIPVAAVIIVLCIIIGAAGGSRCEKDGCNNEPVSGSDYCTLHKCTLKSCNNMRYTGSTYCYTHKKALDSVASSSGSSSSSSSSTPSASDFKLADVKITHNTSYTVCTGKLTNVSSKTFKFVKIKGAFQTSSGTTVDTDWTYAVGAEGLSPKESCTFRMSVPKNSKITKCSISLIK